jgi:hypothetical protein
VIAAFVEILAKSAASEGKEIILSMLVVGLIFVGVAVIGDFLSWLSHR